MKLLHEFEVEKEVEREKTTSRKKRGSDETVTTTKKVKEKVPIKFQVRKPNRRQLEEAELEYTVELNNCIGKGILTKAMLAKKYSDTGGLFSEDNAKRYTDLYTQTLDLQAEYSRLEIATKRSETQEKRLAVVKEEVSKLTREMVELESTHQSLFDHTAEVRAQNKLLLWYTLFLTYIWDDETATFVPFFNGETFEEKQDDFYEKEENITEFYSQVGRKVSTVLALWFFNKASTEEEFEELLDKVDKGEM